MSTTCKYCQHTGLVWYQAKTGKWYLATPLKGTEQPNPENIHLCQFKKGRLPKPKDLASDLAAFNKQGTGFARW